MYGLLSIIHTGKFHMRLSSSPRKRVKWVVRGDDASLILPVPDLSISAQSPLFVDSLHTSCLRSRLSSCPSIPLSPSLCPLWKPLSPLALLLSSPSVRLLQAALLPLCLPHVLPLEDMHLGSRCTLLCVLINILAASGRKWVFLWANLLWGGCSEQRKGKMIEEEGQARLFLFSMSEVVKTSNTNRVPRKCEWCASAEFSVGSKPNCDSSRISCRIKKIILITKLTKMRHRLCLSPQSSPLNLSSLDLFYIVLSVEVFLLCFVSSWMEKNGIILSMR